MSLGLPYMPMKPSRFTQRFLVRCIMSITHGCMTVGVIRNRLAVRSLSKDYLHIIDHIEYILTCSVARLGLVVCLIFKMLAFLSYGVICKKKSSMAKVHNLSTLFKNIFYYHQSSACMHYIPYLIVLKVYLELANHSLLCNNARRSKCSCLCSSYTRTPDLFHKSKSSSSSGLRYTSMSLLGCFRPWMSTSIIINLRFIQN